MCWKDTAGTIYRPFKAQEDGFPKAGKVVRAYHKCLQVELARAPGNERLLTGMMVE